MKIVIFIHKYVIRTIVNWPLKMPKRHFFLFYHTFHFHLSMLLLCTSSNFSNPMLKKDNFFSKLERKKFFDSGLLKDPSWIIKIIWSLLSQWTQRNQLGKRQHVSRFQWLNSLTNLKLLWIFTARTWSGKKWTRYVSSFGSWKNIQKRG